LLAPIDCLKIPAQRAVLTQSFNQRAKLAASEEIEDLALSSNKKIKEAILLLEYICILKEEQI
jgi:hypothetical protein